MLPPTVIALPPPPPPPPRARLSLAEYRQRQAQKLADAPPPEPILSVRTASPTSTLPSAVPSTSQDDSNPSPFPRPSVPSALDTEAALKSIGAYFAREQAAATSGSGSTTSNFGRPIPSPILPSTPASSSSSSTPQARRESRFSQPHPTTPAGSSFAGSINSSALGLETDSIAAPVREYGRQPTVYTGSSYSATNEPLANPPIANVPLRSRTGAMDYPSTSATTNQTVSPAARAHSLNIPPPTADPRLARTSPSSFDAALPTGPRAGPPSPPGPRAVYGYGRPPASNANATYSERQSPIAAAQSPSPYAAPYLSLAGDSQGPTPSAPRGFDSRTGANAATPNRSNSLNDNGAAPNSAPAIGGVRSANQWAPPTSSSVSSFRNATARGGRFDTPSASSTPITPSASAAAARPRYDGQSFHCYDSRVETDFLRAGIPRGPAAMGGAPPSGPRQHPSSEQGGGGGGGRGGGGAGRGLRGGRGGFPGWGRGRGRGRGN